MTDYIPTLLFKKKQQNKTKTPIKTGLVVSVYKI